MMKALLRLLTMFFSIKVLSKFRDDVRVVSSKSKTIDKPSHSS